MQLTIDTIMKKGLVLSLALLLPAMNYGQINEPEKEDETLGISTDFGDVLIENLGIGRTYNLREIAGTPFKVRNRSTEVVDLNIVSTVPDPGLIFSKRKEMGVVPVPSETWVRVAQERFILPPGETAFTDIIITIPDDPALYGRKFQASIHSRTTGRNFIQVGVWSHVILTIVPSPEDQAKMEENRKRGLTKTAEFSLLPDKIYLTNVPIGKPYVVRKENKRTMKIANVGEDEITLSVRTIGVQNSPISLQSGFIRGEPHWLKSKSEKFVLDVDSVVDPKWIVELPNDPKLKGKKIMFAVKIEPIGKDVLGATFFGRFYVEVEK